MTSTRKHNILLTVDAKNNYPENKHAAWEL